MLYLQRACTVRGGGLAVLIRLLPPQSISSATWLRTQRPTLDVFPKSLAHRARPFVATAHSHGKHEIHITRSLSLHLDEQGLGDVRGCAKQLGVFTMLWSSAGADVQHLVIACCRAGLAERWRGGARAFRNAPCLLESAQPTGWSVRSSAAAETGAARCRKPTSAPRPHRPPRCFVGCPCPCCPSPPRSMCGVLAGCPRPGPTGGMPRDRGAPRRAHIPSLLARSPQIVCCIQQSSTKQRRTYPWLGLAR